MLSMTRCEPTRVSTNIYPNFLALDHVVIFLSAVGERIRDLRKHQKNQVSWVQYLSPAPE